MKSDFKHIVKESLREAFYTKKVIINESTEYMWIGVVDSYGALHTQQLSFEDWSYHNVIFPGIRGDRWRFDSGDDEIVWTNDEPSKDSIIAVEDFLIKKGEHPKIRSGLTESFVAGDNLLQKLIESDIPDKNGCWWMRPDLKFFCAYRHVEKDKHLDHETAALIELGRPHPTHPYLELMKRGHVRILVMIDAIYFNPPISPKQLKRLKDICIEIDKNLVFDDGRNEKLIYQSKRFVQEIITESINGQKITVNYYGKPMAAIMSKNTVPGEKEYRISFFDIYGTDIQPRGHFDLSKQEAEEVLQNRKLPDEVIKMYKGISVRNIDGWPEQIKEGTLIEPLDESLVGKKLFIMVGMSQKIPALISKNVSSDEGEYRISWFNNSKELDPRGHKSFDKATFDFIVSNEDLTDKLKRYFSNIFFYPAGEITIKFTDSINENLLLLEESSREIDLWLENKITINESMTMMVSGANYKRTDRLDELVNYLQDNVVSPVLNTIKEPDQIAYFHKNSVGFWNILSADGSYYEKQSGDPGIGTINLYPGGITQIMLRKIVVGILRQLKKLGIKWGQLKREKSGAYKISDVIRIPIVENNSKGYEGPEELSFSNINAYQIFNNLLQFEGEHGFEMDAKELMERIETVLKHDKSWIEKNVIKRTDSDWPAAERDTEEPVENPHLDMMNQIGNQLGDEGGARIIGGGLDAEGIEYRLQLIWKVAKWAADHGYKKISVN